MWLSFLDRSRQWHYWNLFLSPSLFTEKIIRSFDFHNAYYFSWKLDIGKLPRQQIFGPPKYFIHNAGLVDRDYGKEIRETNEAFYRILRKDLQLTAGMQNQAEPPPMDVRIDVIIGYL